MKSALAGGVVLSERELDMLAWEFLGSEFAKPRYADWPVERRIDGYLKRHGMAHVTNDGDAYQAVLQHVLANIGQALRRGVLPDTTWRKRHA